MTDGKKPTIKTDTEAAEYIRSVCEKLAADAAEAGHDQLAHLLRLASMEAKRHLKAKSATDDKN